MSKEIGLTKYTSDVTGETGGYLAFRDIEKGEASKQFVQPEYSRVLDYNNHGKLLGIEFLDNGTRNISNLPQDEIIPSDETIIEVFSASDMSDRASHLSFPIMSLVPESVDMFDNWR